MTGLSNSSDEVLEAILASIRADLHAVSFLDMSSANTAAAWVKEHVPGACSVEPYDLVVCQADQFAQAMAICAPTALLLVQRPISIPLDVSSLPSHEELTKISRVRAGDVEWVLFARQPASPPKAVQVSVIVPSQDQARPLWRLLTALAGDDEAPSWELIVCDRGSFDETTSLLAAVEGAIEVVLLTREASLDDALAMGIERARAPLVAVVDPQVVPTVGWLRALFAAFEDRPGASYCAGNVLSIDADDEPHEDWASFRLFGLRLSHWDFQTVGPLAQKLAALGARSGALIKAPGVEGRLLR
jgi:hypothetical protein